MAATCNTQDSSSFAQIFTKSLFKKSAKYDIFDLERRLECFRILVKSCRLKLMVTLKYRLAKL